MPKYADPEDDAAEGGPVMPIGAPEISASETAKAKGKAKAELSKKELGRIKTKQAVLAKAMEIEGGDGKEGARKSEALGQDEDGPETKRARSDVDVASGGDGDVQMTDG
jgi:tRNA (guanine-N(7)-)-methyltransferase subunit TRM82